MTLPANKGRAELRSRCVTGKRRFRTEQAAEKALALDVAWREAGDPRRREIRSYACDKGCGGWHLTSQPAEPLRSTKPLPHRSKKTAKVYREQRVPLVAQELADNPPCAIRWDERCTGRATTLHELKKRSRGGSITAKANTVPACAYCNGAVEDHPEEAHARGFALHSWEASA